MEGRKPWREMTPIEITKLKQAQCIKCKYFAMAGVGNEENVSNKTCDYILIVGHSRGCDPRDCVNAGIFKKRNKNYKRRRTFC